MQFVRADRIGGVGWWEIELGWVGLGLNRWSFVGSAFGSSIGLQLR